MKRFYTDAATLFLLFEEGIEEREVKRIECIIGIEIFFFQVYNRHPRTHCLKKQKKLQAQKQNYCHQQ